MKNLNNIINQVILILCSASLILIELSPQKAILPITIVITICGVLEYYGLLQLNLTTFLIYCVICILNPYYTFALPAIFYYILYTKYMPFAGLSLIIYIYYLDVFSLNIVIIMFVITLMAVFLKYQEISYHNISQKYIQQRDELTEQSLGLRTTISDLTLNQDLEIKMATLDERNRIAREIHDNVGHLLTRSIIQLGAVLAISKDTKVKENLSTIKDTLDEAMNTIRCSVHDLHEESIEIYEKLNTLVREFDFCEAKLIYEVTSNLEIKTKYSIISIVKEALSNVMRHSNASIVTISMFEHPKFIQLIIQDNGDCNGEITLLKNGGIGLESIRQRVAQLGGHVNFDNKQGFKIFISFPHVK